MTTAQPPFYPAQPLREEPTVLSSVSYTVAGVTVVYQRGTNQAHRLVVGASTGEGYPPRFLASLQVGDTLYAALSDVEYERNGQRLPRVFIAQEQEIPVVFDISWTTALLPAGSTEIKTLDAALLGAEADLALIESISIRPLDANGDSVQVASSLDGAAVADVYLLGSAATPFVPTGVGNIDYGPNLQTVAEPDTIVAKPIHNNTSNGLLAIMVTNSAFASGAARYTVRLRGTVIGRY